MSEESEQALKNKVIILENAIRIHRDQRGDDRCWLDDVELYKNLPEPLPLLNLLPPKEEFLANCARFHASRQFGELPYRSTADVIESIRQALAHLGLVGGVDDVEKVMRIVKAEIESPR